MFCPRCGNRNDDSATFCSSCGNALPPAAHQASSRIAGSQPNADEFYKVAIGPKNQGYYLRHFSRFDSEGKIGISWNWPAFFISLFWFLYRKMWLNALIYFLLPYFVIIPIAIAAGVAGNYRNVVIGLGYLVYAVCIFVLLPMYANALYYKYCTKKISEVKTSSTNFQRQLGELSAKGGTGGVVFIVVFVFVFIWIIGILAAVAIPAYQDYTTRVRLIEAVLVGRKAVDSITTYYYQHQQIPSSLEQSGFVEPLPTSIKEISSNNQDGVVTITMANAPVEGKNLLFVPSLDANNKIIWKCMSQDIKDRYLPLECRQSK